MAATAPSQLLQASQATSFRPTLRPAVCRRRRSAGRVQACQRPKQSFGSTTPLLGDAQQALKLVRSSADTFLQRYDVLPCAVGALAVTSFCVAKGQDPFTAASITLASTVAALVINELLLAKDI